MNIIYHLILKFLNEEKFKTIFLIILSLIINFFKINVISYITANIIKYINIKDYALLNKYFYYFIIISVIYIILYIFYKHFQNKLTSNLRQWLRHELIKSILIINNEELSELNFSKLSSPILRITNNFFVIFNNLVTIMIPNLSFLIIVFLYFIYKNTLLGVIFLIGNIILLIYLWNIINTIIEHNKKYEDKVLINEASIVEIFNNIDKIILKGNINEEINNFSNSSDKVKNLAFKFYSVSTYYVLFMNIIILVTILLCIYLMIRLYSNNKISATIFITFLTILLLYRDIITATIMEIPILVEFFSRSQNIITIFESMNKNYINIFNKKYNKINLEFKKISFKNIHFQYKEGDKKIFEDFNLELKTDKIIGIVGSSGKGKSTLVKLLIKLYNYDGNIYIDEVNIQKMCPIYIRKNIVYVHQNSKLFDKKIYDNLFYGCDNLNICNKYFKDIMKYKKINELYQTIDLNKSAGFNGENLSGGQKQIINIINGLVSPSKIVILDEPTNALDRELKKDVINMIKDFKKYKKAIIIITHDKDIYPILDEKIELNN
jgi:ABC-type bacteriocin/lantibiotic exporter with double-glycine peptidase domain